MGWAIGFDDHWARDIGYGVVAYCDHPDCNKEINRGLSYVCAEEELHGGDGCGLYFCEHHHNYWKYPEDYDKIIADGGKEPEPELTGCCERCAARKEPFQAKPELPDWAWWKMNSKSWHEWRSELTYMEREKWLRLAEQYDPSEDDIEEAKEDE